LGVLIEISRLDTGRLEPDISVFPLQDVFARLQVEFQPLAREKRLELRIVPTRLWVRSDRRLLRRILQNLLSNAIKYTATGKVLLGVRRHGDRLVVLVCDTGPGIPGSKHQLIFQEFERLPQTAGAVRGLGLGLSIVERIGKVLDHRVGLRSVLDHGSTFSVELACAGARAVEPATAMAPSVGRIAGLTVLCIDNEPAGLAGMQVLLEGWGCRAITARTAAEAIARLAQSAARPDILLADYHLDGGTGLEAVAAVRAAGHDCPVIIITADHSADVQRKVRLHGYHLLRKPLKAAALRALMYQLTWQRAVAAE
jgi:CheY-like chemotaxis protein/anti-sigma regulatory factor (Ser/Thr protein kinase)